MTRRLGAGSSIVGTFAPSVAVSAAHAVYLELDFDAAPSVEGTLFAATNASGTDGLTVTLTATGRIRGVWRVGGAIVWDGQTNALTPSARYRVLVGTGGTNAQIDYESGGTESYGHGFATLTLTGAAPATQWVVGGVGAAWSISHCTVVTGSYAQYSVFSVAKGGLPQWCQTDSSKIALWLDLRRRLVDSSGRTGQITSATALSDPPRYLQIGDQRARWTRVILPDYRGRNQGVAATLTTRTDLTATIEYGAYPVAAPAVTTTTGLTAAVGTGRAVDAPAVTTTTGLSAAIAVSQAVAATPTTTTGLTAAVGASAAVASTTTTTTGLTAAVDVQRGVSATSTTTTGLGATVAVQRALSATATTTTGLAASVGASAAVAAPAVTTTTSLTAVVTSSGGGDVAATPTTTTGLTATLAADYRVAATATTTTALTATVTARATVAAPAVTTTTGLSAAIGASSTVAATALTTVTSVTAAVTASRGVAATATTTTGLTAAVIGSFAVVSTVETTTGLTVTILVERQISEPWYDATVGGDPHGEWRADSASDAAAHSDWNDAEGGGERHDDWLDV